MCTLVKNLVLFHLSYSVLKECVLGKIFDSKRSYSTLAFRLYFRMQSRGSLGQNFGT